MPCSYSMTVYMHFTDDILKRAVIIGYFYKFSLVNLLDDDSG